MPVNLGYPYFGHTGVRNRIEIAGGGLVGGTLAADAFTDGVHIEMCNGAHSTDNTFLITDGGNVLVREVRFAGGGRRNVFTVEDGVLECALVTYSGGGDNVFRIGKDGYVEIRKGNYGVLFQGTGDLFEIRGGKMKDPYGYILTQGSGNVFRITEGGSYELTGNSVAMQGNGGGNLIDVEDGELHCTLIACTGNGEMLRVGANGYLKTTYYVDWYIRGSDNLFEIRGGRADFHLGYMNIGYQTTLHTGNKFRVSDGGLVDAKAPFYLYGSGNMAEIVGTNPVDGTPSELDMTGYNFELGDSVYFATYPDFVDNSLRTGGGGLVKCKDLIVQSGNGLAPVVCAESDTRQAGTGCVYVSGTATFKSGTYVKPSAEKDAPAGKYKILEAGTLDDFDNIELIPPDAPGAWALIPDGDSIWLRYSHPMTIMIVR